MQPHPENLRGYLHIPGLAFDARIGGIDEEADEPRLRDQFVNKLQPFRSQLPTQGARAREVAPGMVEARDQSERYRINPDVENYRNRGGRRLRGARGRDT